MKITADGNASEAFGRAYDEFAEAIFRHCRFRIRDRERAKELMQEAFIKTWEYIARGNDIDNVRAFLYRAANNLVIDEVRRNKRRPTTSLDELQEAGFDIGTNIPKEEMENAVDGQRLLNVLGQIGSPHREILIMRYVDNLTPSEIASVIGKSTNVVSVRLHRGLKHLRSLIHA